MQRMILDSQANGSFHLLSVSPRVDRETGEIRTDREGVPQHELECLRREEDGPAEVVKVRITTEKPPDIQPMTEVRFSSLQAFFWEMRETGRSGISLSCSDVVPANAAPASQARGQQRQSKEHTESDG